MRLGIPFFNQMTAVKILTDGTDDTRHVTGLLAVRPRESTDENPLGLVLFACPTVVLAVDGPGELYRDSVFPNGCFGSLGLALEAGMDLVNVTESQFGIGIRREGFPWNLSGTYVQVMPYIYSVDVDGAEHNFLADYYRTTQELVSNIFRKGYQWPFHAERMLDFQSSLVDLAIFRESQAGRRVFMDFNRNPLPVPGDRPFDLTRLDEDVHAYLSNAGAMQDMPIDRLRHMNPLAIELYRRYKVDIAAEPLEFAVNNQHMNGGIAVDSWGRTSLRGVYAVGEAAGTHGVTRPGGSALNAGQVFGTRVGEHIAADRPQSSDTLPDATGAIEHIQTVLRGDGGLPVREVRDAVQARMSDHAGLICTPEAVSDALGAARDLNAQIRARGLTTGRSAEIGRALQWHQMALASEAVLTALDHYIRQGGGSRGTRAICDPDGTAVPQAKDHPLTDYRFRPERDADKEEQILIRLTGVSFAVATRKNRRFNEGAKAFFERDWPAWLTGEIYDRRGA